MPRKPLSLDELVPAEPGRMEDPLGPAREPDPIGEGWDATATIYARIPAELYERLRRRAFELTKGRRRVTMQDVLTTALKEHLDRAGG
jgi:hypothetical protein